MFCNIILTFYLNILIQNVHLFTFTLYALMKLKQSSSNASNAKIMGSIPSKMTQLELIQMYTLALMQCTFLQIKASAKCINVNNLKRLTLYDKIQQFYFLLILGPCNCH